MMEKKKPDILDEILKGDHENTTSGLEELINLIHRSPTQPSSKTSIKKQRLKGNKKRATHYLSKDVFEELNSVHKKLKKILPAGEKSRITKSRIVNSALKMILNDFEARGEDSPLIQQILKKNRTK